MYRKKTNRVKFWYKSVNLYSLGGHFLVLEILIFSAAIGGKKVTKWSKMIQIANHLLHQRLLVNKTSNNYCIRCTGVKSTSLEGIFKFLKTFAYTIFYGHKKVTKSSKITHYTQSSIYT